MSALLGRALAIVIAMVMVAGCERHDQEIESRDVLRVGVATPVLLASQQNLGLGFHKAALTRETLVTIGPDGRPLPRIIDAWEADARRLVWRLRLRNGVQFHDGTPITASELAPLVGRSLDGLSLGAVARVEAEGTHVLRVTLNEPYAFLFDDLALISAQRVVDGKTYDTGPYTVAEESQDRLLFKAVPSHYRGRPAVDQIEVALYPDQRNAWSALMRDQIDMLYEVSRDAIDLVRSESSVSVSTFPRPYVFLLGLNSAHPSLRDPRVRQALNRAVDRDALVRLGLAGEGEPAFDHVWPRHWAYDADARTEAAYNPQAAVALLEAAGLDLQRAPGRMPARLRIHCLVYEPLRKLALVLQRQLAQADVDLQLEIVPTGRLIQRIGEGNFESFVFEMASARGFKFPYQFWHSDVRLLPHGYSGADAELDRVRRAATDEEFKAAVSALQRRFHEAPPAVFLAWGRTSRAVNRRFDIAAAGEDVYHAIARWTRSADN